MPPSGATISHDGISPSLRLSCDRCRAHKLKCSGPAGANNTCQRCKRAEAPCVFGRRAPSKRRLSKTNPADQALNTPGPGAVTPVSLATPPPASSSAFATAATSSSSCPGLTLGGQLEVAAMDTDLALPPVPEMDTNPFEAPAAWESLTTGYMSECGSDTVAYDWIQPGWAPNQAAMFDACQSDMAPWPQMATPTPPEIINQPADAMDLVSSTDPSTAPSTTGSTAGSTASSNEIPPSQRLTSLVSDIQQQLRRLEEGPWHTDSACSLDDYPVGTILELVQQFGALAGPILSRIACRGGSLDNGAAINIMNDHEPSDCGGGGSGTNSANEDTPTMLLVMCGYMWLVRIYGVVLSHFQKHLHHRSAHHHIHDHFNNSHHHHHHRRTGTTTNPFDSSSKSSSSSTTTATPSTPTPTPTLFSTPSSIPPTARGTPATLRLSELPCASAEALHLQQIHTAVRLLLDTLHDDVEAHLGRGATVARAMAVALLLRSGGGGSLHEWDSGSSSSSKNGGGGGGSVKIGGGGSNSKNGWGPGRCHGVGAGIGVADGLEDGLDRKASAVRELLRERMGL